MENNLSTKEPTPEITMSLPQTKSEKNPFLGLIILLILVILVLAGAIYFLINQRQTAINLQPVPQTSLVIAPSQIPTIPAIPTVIADIKDWATYSDSKAGFSFKYPKTILLNSELKNATQTILTVSVEKLADIPEDLPMMLGRTDALAEKALLAKNTGENLQKIGDLNGQISTTLAQFDVCSVMFVRRLRFYPGEYRVNIALTAPKTKILTEMPEFFQTDSPNCGESLVWNQAKINDFEPSLISHSAKGTGQEWYDTFNQILKTLQLASPASEATPSGLSYKNTQYNFELNYNKPYRVLSNKADLSGYPNGVALLYTGGQAYDIVIEVWDKEADFLALYGTRIKSLKVLKLQNKFITLLNNTDSVENQKIIDSAKISSN